MREWPRFRYAAERWNRRIASNMTGERPSQECWVLRPEFYEPCSSQEHAPYDFEKVPQGVGERESLKQYRHAADWIEESGKGDRGEDEG